MGRRLGCDYPSLHLFVGERSIRLSGVLRWLPQWSPPRNCNATAPRPRVVPHRSARGQRIDAGPIANFAPVEPFGRAVGRRGVRTDGFQSRIGTPRRQSANRRGVGKLDAVFRSGGRTGVDHDRVWCRRSVGGLLVESAATRVFRVGGSGRVHPGHDPIHSLGVGRERIGGGPAAAKLTRRAAADVAGPAFRAAAFQVIDRVRDRLIPHTNSSQERAIWS